MLGRAREIGQHALLADCLEEDIEEQVIEECLVYSVIDEHCTDPNISLSRENATAPETGWPGGHLSEFESAEFDLLQQ